MAPDAGEIVYMIGDAVAGIDDAGNAGAETTMARMKQRVRVLFGWPVGASCE